jgi:uncharacterized integral membrane protein
MKGKMLSMVKKYYPYFVDVWQYLIVVLVVIVMLVFIIPNIK